MGEQGETCADGATVSSANPLRSSHDVNSAAIDYPIHLTPSTPSPVPAPSVRRPRTSSRPATI